MCEWSTFCILSHRTRTESDARQNERADTMYSKLKLQMKWQNRPHAKVYHFSVLASNGTKGRVFAFVSLNCANAASWCHRLHRLLLLAVRALISFSHKWIERFNSIIIYLCNCARRHNRQRNLSGGSFDIKSAHSEWMAATSCMCRENRESIHIWNFHVPIVRLLRRISTECTICLLGARNGCVYVWIPSSVLCREWQITNLIGNSF